ncbi:hypothetical protein BMY_1112 [Wohlfahrtiimonas chitiniclastica]|nr:hypothetical protein BMY_1112 [Wohlfahrtiimonas chitiniclastica]
MPLRSLALGIKGREQVFSWINPQNDVMDAIIVAQLLIIVCGAALDI